MKKTLLLLTTIILAFSLSACNLFGPTPDEVATDFLTSVQKGEWEKASEYVNTEDSKEKIKEFTTSDEDVKYIEDLFEKMSFTIGNVKEEEDKATVESEIETVDMKIIMGTIFQEMLAEAFAQAFSGEETDEEAQDEEMTKLLVEGMNEPSAKKVTNKVNIKLVKVDGDWKVDVSDELLNALTGGLSSMGEEMEGTELNPFGQ
jgi:predicted small lipoprotein YifL